jgi:hypothetical protein
VSASPAGPLARPIRVAAWARRDTAPPATARPRAVELSDGYARRLAIHRAGSYAMLPLFAAQYVIGQRMFEQKRELRAGRRSAPIDDGLRDAHRVAAIGVGVVFATNTVTGTWNLYESRGIADRRALRTAHSLLMLAADAGFVASSVMGAEGRKHRNLAIASVGVSTLSAAAMVIFDRD